MYGEHWLQVTLIIKLTLYSCFMIINLTCYRAKQEQLERKKAEEKMRREAIFQEYLKRKEQDSGEDEPKVPPPVQKRAHSKSRPKVTRPKSQPAAAAVDDVPAPSPLVVSSTTAPSAPPSQSGDQPGDIRKSPTDDMVGKRKLFMI